MHYYRLYDWTVGAEMALPELTPAGTPARVDIWVRQGEAPARLPAEEACKAGYLYDGHLYYQLGEHRLLLDLEGVARFLISDRDTVTAAPAPGVSAGEWRAYLLGLCFGFLLPLRGQFALHGSAVAAGGEALLFVGRSGAGKSTLAAKCVERGWRLLADDVSLVRFDEAGRPRVFPAYPHVKLWADSARLLGVSIEGLSPISPDLEKYRVGFAPHFLSEPRALRHIFILEPGESGPPRAEALSGARKIEALLPHIYRSVAVRIFDMQAEHFLFCSRLAAAAPVSRLHRPAAGGDPAELLPIIESVSQKSPL
jgi:hypothetical protein